MVVVVMIGMLGCFQGVWCARAGTLCIDWEVLPERWWRWITLEVVKRLSKRVNMVQWRQKGQKDVLKKKGLPRLLCVNR